MGKTISWFIALLITLSVAIFQFIMGSSYPLVTEVNTGKQRIECVLYRSFTGKNDCPIILPIGDITVSGYLNYKIYQSDEKMSRIDFTREGDILTAKLPNQSPAGKLEYSVVLSKEGKPIDVNDGKPIIIRFLGRVPVTILVLQSLFIFLALLLSNMTGMYAALGIKTYRLLIYITIASMMVALFLFQPLMHKYALNQWWTCFPNSRELGDNKILIALMVWILAMYLNFRKSRRGVVVLAALASILILSIPHGFPGIQHDPVNMNIVQRNLLSLLQLF